MGLIMRKRKCYTGKVKERPTIETFEFNVTVDVTTAWGNGYYGEIVVDTGIDLTNKKIFATAVVNATAPISVSRGGTNSVLVVDFFRATSRTGLTGKLYVMVTD